MTTVTLRTPAEIVKAVPHLIGFEPSDSLVVVSLGGGPHARVDLGDEEGLMQSLGHALPHWTGGVLLVVYGSHEEHRRIWNHAAHIFPSVPIMAVLGVRGQVVHRDPDDEGEALEAELPEALTAKSVAPTRDHLVEEAAQVEEADDAERLAVESYERGDGARAWAYYDRAVVLRGEATEAMCTLAQALTTAAPPPNWTPVETETEEV